MHNDEKTKGANRMQHFLAHAHSRAVLPYLVIGLLMLFAIVGIGREIEHPMALSFSADSLLQPCSIYC